MARAPSVPQQQRAAHQKILECKRDQLWREAVATIAEMRQEGTPLSTVSYNAAIDACGKAKQVQTALELFDELHQVGNVPDAVTYTALIDACGRVGLLDQAFMLFTRMQTAHVEPNLITYNALIHACAQVGATDAAFQVWHQLRAAGRTQPNVRTYTELIGACCKTHSLDAAFGLLYQMQQELVEPSRVTYDILLRAACGANSPSRFYELKQLIASARVQLSEATVQLIHEVDQSMASTGSLPHLASQSSAHAANGPPAAAPAMAPSMAPHAMAAAPSTEGWVEFDSPQMMRGPPSPHMMAPMMVPVPMNMPMMGPMMGMSSPMQPQHMYPHMMMQGYPPMLYTY